MKKRITMTLAAVAASASIAMGATTETRNYHNTVKEMTETFCEYARINSQSKYPESGAGEFTMTPGQGRMAEKLVEDIRKAEKKYGMQGIKLTRSTDNYVYLTIPATDGCEEIPTIGISCHLDVTPEVDFGDRPIVPIVIDELGRTLVKTDGTTLLGADDKCGCTIAITLIRSLFHDSTFEHGRMQFAFCPNEDVGMAAERIDTTLFSPDIIFDIDGEDPYKITDANFTAWGLNLKFKGNSVHPSEAKKNGLGDPVAAAATFIANIPVQYRPENSEGREGYIHPWNMTRQGEDVLVETRIRYFSDSERDLFDGVMKKAAMKAAAEHPNVEIEAVYDAIQYENVAKTMHPKAHELVKRAAETGGIPVEFMSSRGGTTASMFAAKGLKGGMCIFSGQHNPHSLNEYADIDEMYDAYCLLLHIIGQSVEPDFWK